MRYRYRYVGETPCWTHEPTAEWAPGEVKTVEQPIRNNPLFVEVPADEDEAPSEEEDGAPRRGARR